MEKLRFDFNCKKPLTPNQVQQVQDIVNQQIEENRQVYTQVVPLAQARAINTLRAVFGETYPDPVRVVSVGAPVDSLVADPENSEWSGFSVELCGGTHIPNTSAAGAFLIVEETAIAKGIRRVTAVTTSAAARAAAEGRAMADRVEAAAALQGEQLVAEEKLLVQALEAAPISVPLKAELKAKLAKLTARVKAFKKAAMAGVIEQAKAAGVQQARDAPAPALVTLLSLGSDSSAGRAVCSAMQEAAPELSIMVFSVDAEEGRVSLFASCPNPAALPANKWIAHAVAAVGGKGGGKPEYAQAQAKNKGLEDAQRGMEAARLFAAGGAC